MTDKTFDIMLDLETMGTGPNAAIVAIGAVAFDLQAGTIGDRFYRVVDLGTSVDMGGEIDADTVLWWMKQSDDARAMFARDGAALSEALADFSLWLSAHGAPDNVRVWGNGAAFDNVILSSAYRRSGYMQPWRHWNDRCRSLRRSTLRLIVCTHERCSEPASTKQRASANAGRDCGQATHPFRRTVRNFRTVGLLRRAFRVGQAWPGNGRCWCDCSAVGGRDRKMPTGIGNAPGALQRFTRAYNVRCRPHEDIVSPADRRLQPLRVTGRSPAVLLPASTNQLYLQASNKAMSRGLRPTPACSAGR